MSASFVLDDNPKPVDELPPRGQFGGGGRGKSPEYLALAEKLAKRPGVEHKLAVLPAINPVETKRARRQASGLRSTLKRYGIAMTERKRDGAITIYGRYIG